MTATPVASWAMAAIVPPVTVQVWVGDIGCWVTVTATSAPFATRVENMNVPSAVSGC